MSDHYLNTEPNRRIRGLNFLVCLLFFSGLKAQDCDTTLHHFPGAVILRAGYKSELTDSTIRGCIDLMKRQEMMVAPRLIDNSGKTIRYYGREALAYWYVRNQDTLYWLNSGKNLYGYRWIYLERIVMGHMELYYFSFKGTSFPAFTQYEFRYFYFRKDGQWLNKKAISRNQRNNRKQLRSIFSDCAPALDLIENTECAKLEDILPTLVNIYNSEDHKK